MSHMQMQIYEAADTWAGDCDRCGTTLYWHPSTSVNDLDDFKRGWGDDARCSFCADGSIDRHTVTNIGPRYAGRYSAPGYLDCTDWSYNKDAAELKTELRDMYGDENEQSDEE